MSDHVTILFANDAFYAAFAGRDVAAMDDVWSQRSQVSCIHPGWAPLLGREAVMDSWRAILGNPASPKIASRDASVHVLGETAYVVCLEMLAERTVLAATNVFVREDGAWKLIHHQAGATPPPTSAAPDSPASTLQ